MKRSGNERSAENRRRLMSQYIEARDYKALFTGGGCYFFALVLHENLSLPLFYSSTYGTADFAHVFVKRNQECFDYLGSRPVAEIAKCYSGWADVEPQQTTAETIHAKIAELDLGDLIEDAITRIAREQFAAHRERYQ